MPIPSNSPIILPVILCQGGCRSYMRIEREYSPKGVITKMVAYCDSCKYGRNLSYEYANGLDVKYVAPVSPSLGQAQEPPKFTPPPPAPQTPKMSPPPAGPVRAEADENTALAEALQAAQAGTPTPEPESIVGLTGQ